MKTHVSDFGGFKVSPNPVLISRSPYTTTDEDMALA
jgi:hypothetical protein